MSAVQSPAPRAEWRAVLAADPDALACQSPEWLDAVCRDGHFEDASRLYEGADGQPIVLPLARHRGFLTSALAPQGSMPEAWGMGGVLVGTEPTVADIRRVVADLRTLPALRTTVRPNPLHAAAWDAATRGARAVRIPRRAHVLDLAGGADVVWSNRFASSARRAVRKAERSGLEVRCGVSPAALSDYRRLFDLSVARWAEAQHEPLPLARLRARRRDPPAKLARVAARTR